MVFPDNPTPCPRCTSPASCGSSRALHHGYWDAHGLTLCPLDWVKYGPITGSPSLVTTCPSVSLISPFCSV